MSHRHVIRLHAAWTRHTPDDASAASSGLKVDLPDASLAGLSTPKVLYRRRFHRPTGLTPTSRVYFRCGLIPLAVRIGWNQSPWTPPAGESLVEVTTRLQAHNEVELEIASDSFSAAAQATAELEIHDR